MQASSSSSSTCSLPTELSCVDRIRVQCCHGASPTTSGGGLADWMKIRPPCFHRRVYIWSVKRYLIATRSHFDNKTERSPQRSCRRIWWPHTSVMAHIRQFEGLHVRCLLSMQSITSQCQLPTAFGRTPAKCIIPPNNGEERSLCGVVLAKLTRPFTAFWYRAGCLAQWTAYKFADVVWKAQMSTLFTTATGALPEE